MKYKIRHPFVVKLSDKVIHHAGEVIELTDEQAELHRLKIEPADEPKAAPKPKVEKADAK